MLTAAQTQAIASGAPATLSATTIGSLQTINVNNISGTATPTANVTLSANLPANDSSGTAETMTVPIYDSLGIEHDMSLTLTPTGTANQWSASASFANAGTSTATIAAGDNIVQFNPDGTLDSAASTFNTANALSISWDPTLTRRRLAADRELQSRLQRCQQRFEPTRQRLYRQQHQPGWRGAGKLLERQHRPERIDHREFHQWADATPSPSSRSRRSRIRTNWRRATTAPTRDAGSGVALVRQPGTGAAGQIDASSLENSTVDIASEFSQLIVAQNAYQANSKVITVSDQMMQALLAIQTA